MGFINIDNYTFRGIYYIEDLFSAMDEIYNDFYSRIDLEKWNELFDTPAAMKIIISSEPNKKLFNFFLHHKNLPSEIWLLIEERFGLIRYKEKFSEIFGESIIEEVFVNIESPNYLSYKYLEEINYFNMDEYLYLRELTYYSILEDELDKTENYMLEAYGIYKKDPELLRLMGEYYFIENNYVLADKYLSQAVCINESDMKAAELLNKNNEYLSKEENEDVDYVNDEDMPKTLPDMILEMLKTMFSVYIVYKIVVKVYFLLFA